MRNASSRWEKPDEAKPFGQLAKPTVQWFVPGSQILRILLSSVTGNGVPWSKGKTPPYASSES